MDAPLRWLKDADNVTRHVTQILPQRYQARYQLLKTRYQREEREFYLSFFSDLR